MDLGVSEPAHVVRRLGESSPEDKGTFGKMQIEGEVGWEFNLVSLPGRDTQAPSLSPPFIRMPALNRSSPDPHFFHPKPCPRRHRLGLGWADRNGPHRLVAGHHPGPGCAAARAGVDPQRPG